MSNSYFWISIMFYAAVIFILPAMKTDDTDKSFWTRSGMVLYTDHRTGLQYLGTSGLFSAGALIPRLDENGNHMRVK